jgi:hypothetical protein
MDKIDRLGWADGFSFRSHGLTIGVRVTDQSVLAQVRRFLPPGWRPSRSPLVEHVYSIVVGGEGPRPGLRRYNLLYAGPGRLARSMDFEDVLGAFESNLHFYVAQFARRRIFVHAGVVGWAGQAILVPGRSFSGKSTLVEALVRAGATYYSDEFAVLDEKGRVYPFPRPLSLRGGEASRPVRVTAEMLGGSTGTRPLPVGLVALLRHAPDGRWRHRELGPGEAALGLLSNTVSVRMQPDATLRVLREVVRSAAAIRGIRGDAAEAAERILARLPA